MALNAKLKRPEPKSFLQHYFAIMHLTHIFSPLIKINTESINSWRFKRDVKERLLQL